MVVWKVDVEKLLKEVEAAKGRYRAKIFKKKTSKNHPQFPENNIPSPTHETVHFTFACPRGHHLSTRNI